MPLKLHGQRGFTTVTIMGVLAIGGLLVAAGFAAVDPDISLSRTDQDSKQSYGAAEAGLQWYLNRLGQDNNLYVRCTNVPPPTPTEVAPVNQRWSGSGSDPRVWRKLPGEESEYTIELVPAAGNSSCVQNNQYSMVDSEGNLRLRVSGRSRKGVRTVLATLRRLNFLDFIYFTHFETSDPGVYANASATAQAEAECSTFRDERTSFCQEIQFAPADFVRGPLHTNDNIRVCEGPTFGRNSRDSIEISGTPTYVAAPGCSANPVFQGTLIPNAAQLGMPPSNTELASIAQDAYRFNGHTRIEITGDTMIVRNQQRFGSTPQSMPLPPNGVIYVFNISCTGAYARSQTYTNPAGCGDVWVKGHYARDLTIGAQNDVVINGNLTRDDPGLLLGLVGNNFVRVYHPVVSPPPSGTDSSTIRNNCVNATGTLVNPTIQAAILALQHSFLVDNWYCGLPLGDLTIEGAIAQKYRGPVGTVNGSSIYTGYRKQYYYNDRLRYREPPYFLDPVQASWRIARETEQVPATRASN